MISVEGALAVTRFGLGAQPNEIAIASRSPKEWLPAQLKPENTKGTMLDSV